jgi:signal transduction histidine kinase
MQPGVAQGSGVRRRGRVSPPVLTSALWAVGIIVTSLILGTPYLVFGYHSPSLHLVLDSVDGCIALLVAYLLYGRWVRSRRLQDLLLAQGLLLLAIAGLGITLPLDHLSAASPRTLDVWIPMTVRVAGALLILAAALVADRPARTGARASLHALPWALVVLVCVVLWLVRDQLPPGLDAVPPASAQRPVISGHPLLLVAQGVAGVCFLVASFAFTRQAVRRGDELLRWLGPACVLGAFARLNYVLFPSLYSDWLYTGDILRTGSYVLLLVGAAREIGRYWSAQARAAVLEDRRRLARELHDGVVQELGYIRAEAHTTPSDTGAGQRIIDACDRALDEARAAIDALGRGSDEPLGFVLHRAAQQVAERYDGHVVVDLDDSVEVDASQRHALVRITREAISNALRHGKAQTVFVRLLRDQGRHRLVVQDDGAGFAPGAASGSPGYGLTSMRERALGLPGSFELDSSPGGTTVAVTW